MTIAEPVHAPDPRPGGRLARMRTLWRLFRNEKTDPEPFYAFLGAQAVDDIERVSGPVANRIVVDLGCGPGHYTRAFRARGAAVVPIEFDPSELTSTGAAPAGAVVGDARRIPVRSASADGVFCSNMLEHTPEPAAVIDEMARVLRSGGWGYLSWTNWFSPWGGHDISPFHYLGVRRGMALHRLLGRGDPKNVPGVNLFPTHIGATIDLVAGRSDTRVERIEPRYWPWAPAIVAIPGVREVLTWNCVIRFRKR